MKFEVPTSQVEDVRPGLTLCVCPRVVLLKAFDNLVDAEQSDGAGRLRFYGGFRLFGALCASSEHVDRVLARLTKSEEPMGIHLPEWTSASFLFGQFACADSFYTSAVVNEFSTAALLSMPTSKEFTMSNVLDRSALVRKYLNALKRIRWIDVWVAHTVYDQQWCVHHSLRRCLWTGFRCENLQIRLIEEINACSGAVM